MNIHFSCIHPSRRICRQCIESEQRRRDELRDGYRRLKDALPVSNQKSSNFPISNGTRLVDLEGGMIAPAFIPFGSNLGLQEIAYEPSTGDGPPFDPFAEDVLGVLRDPGGIVQAMDALEFQTRNALYALLILCQVDQS